MGRHGSASRLWVALAFLGAPAAAAAPSEAMEASLGTCFERARPQARSDFPSLLNCLGLTGEAVEVGVQAGVHASAFLQSWHGRRLRLVDRWGLREDASGPRQLFYVDIANIRGGAERLQQHRAQCERRLQRELAQGRAEIVSLDSVVAAAAVADASLDFVYLDARHDFAGVVADIHAWWPKVKVGGVFAGHDYVDGEFPEGDFFWISALRAVLPDLGAHVHMTEETNRYPSFFVVKTEEASRAELRAPSAGADAFARQVYAERSRYFRLWRELAQEHSEGGAPSVFTEACNDMCGLDCSDRVEKFTPTRSTVSTLRPFSCGDPQGSSAEQPAGMVDECAAEMVVDVKAYQGVCLERCNVTCAQRSLLFAQLASEDLVVA